MRLNPAHAWLNFWRAVRYWQFLGYSWRAARVMARRSDDDLLTWRGPL